MQIEDGWITVAQRVHSPNCDSPVDFSPELVVVHCISLPAGHYGNDCVEHLFTNRLDCDQHPDFDDIRDLKVSSHFFIRRDGRLVQFVPINQRAWHAGESSFKGRSHCNDFSVGIELEGVDTGFFTAQQYEVLASVCRVLMLAFSIPVAHIVGHSDIAPGRKQDPGIGFDWLRLRVSVET